MTQLKKIIPILIVVITALTFISCEKEEEIIEAITENEAVEIIESALQSKTGGLTSNLEDLVEQLVNAVASGELCDTLYTNTIEKDHQGIQVQATYTSDVSYEMTCNNFDIPQTASFSMPTTSMYDTRKINSEDEGDFTGNAIGLQPTSSTLTIDGKYSRTGTQDLDFIKKKSINSTFTVDLITLEINKQSHTIESGNGTFLLSGTTTDNTSSYSGNIVFNGDQTATLTINGTAHEIDWN